MTRSQAKVIASFSAGDGLLPARAPAYIQLFGRRAIANPSRRGCYAASPHLVHPVKTACQNRAVNARDGAHGTKLFAWLGFERLLIRVMYGVRASSAQVARVSNAWV